jgi:hypothetical protein
MRQNNFGKKILMTVFPLVFTMTLRSQSIILRPSYGTKWIWTKPVSPSYFDPSFNGKSHNKKFSVLYGAELMYPKGSYEIALTNQDYALDFYTYNQKVGSLTDREVGYFRQVQMCYNRFFPLKGKTGNLSLMPIVSLGFSVGFNGNSYQYDYANSENMVRYYSVDFLGEYTDMKLTDKQVNKVAIGGIIKIGVRIMVKGIERGRVQLYYNPGFNKIAQRDYLYYHTNQKFSGTAVSRGSQISVFFSVPIYLKRKK